jgi:hypothetical protein
MSDENSNRTLAGSAAVIGLLALVISLFNANQTGMLSQLTGIDKSVGEGNDRALLMRIEALEGRVAAAEAKAAAPAPAPPPAAPPAEGAGE